MNKPPVLISACLAGLCTRYDGKIFNKRPYTEQLKNRLWIPICPEQLGGLPTPRAAADIVGGNGADVLNGAARVICKDGTDVTEAFVNGARQVLEVVRQQRITTAYLKARSPSCGVMKQGVLAALLEQNGVTLHEID